MHAFQYKVLVESFLQKETFFDLRLSAQQFAVQSFGSNLELLNSEVRGCQLVHGESLAPNCKVQCAPFN